MAARDVGVTDDGPVSVVDLAGADAGAAQSAGLEGAGGETAAATPQSDQPANGLGRATDAPADGGSLHHFHHSAAAGTAKTPTSLMRAGAHFKRRRWPRRLLVGANILVVVCLIASLSAYGYIRWRLGEINSVKLPHLAPLRGASPQDGGIGGAAETILIVGSDTRAALHAGQAKNFGSASDVGGQRSDTIMLLRVDPHTNEAMLLSVPRDLWVPIPGTARRDRINTTFNKGPDLLVQAITEDLHIEVNHYIEVDFDSFRGMVNAINGIKIYFPTPARDFYSGLNITTPGCYNLNGDMALAYVRARHYQYLEHGFWHIEPESDLARIRRQQDFARKVITKVVDSGLTDPSRLNGVVGAVVSNLTVDSGLKSNQADLLRVVKLLKRIGGNALTTMTVPNVPTVIGGGDVLLLKRPDAQQTVDHFLGLDQAAPAPPGTAGVPALPAPAPVSASDVRVRVENGSGRTGQAGASSRGLANAGFVVTGAGPADNYRYPTSVIRYATDAQAKAELLQSYVGGGATLEPDPGLTGSDLVLITGASYQGITPSTAAVGTSAPAAATSAPAAATSAPAPTTTTTEPAIPGMPANPPPC